MDFCAKTGQVVTDAQAAYVSRAAATNLTGALGGAGPKGKRKMHGALCGKAKGRRSFRTLHAKHADGLGAQRRGVMPGLRAGEVFRCKSEAVNLSKCPGNGTKEHGKRNEAAAREQCLASKSHCRKLGVKFAA